LGLGDAAMHRKAAQGLLEHPRPAIASQPDIARLLLLLESAGVEVSELLPWRAFTVYAVQFRYDDEPDVLGLDRGLWCDQAETLINRIEQLNR
jgi:hypothetical protein